MRTHVVLAASLGLLLTGQDSCSTTDADGDGWAAEAGDCNDDDPEVHPGATETWADCLDSDCDGLDFLSGDGRDGILEVGEGETMILEVSSTHLAADAAAGEDEITPEDLSFISRGDVLLIRVSSGTAEGVGQYELAKVLALNDTTVTLSAPLQGSYSASDSVDIMRLPQFQSVTLAAGATLSPPDWNGDSGGLLAFLVEDTLVLEDGSVISGSARGYRGGERSYEATEIGQQGESMAGLGIGTTAANMTGGGGGSAPSYAHADGGGGGHASAGETGGAYNGYSTTPGEGGEAVDSETLDYLRFGGAGGAGGLDVDPGSGAYGGGGGAGGGAILILASNLVLDGTIEVDGGKGEDGQISGSASPGGGGGGAGGAIRLEVASVLSAEGGLSALGGEGGMGSEAGSSITYGGKGGEGVILFSGDDTPGSAPELNILCEE